MLCSIAIVIYVLVFGAGVLFLLSLAIMLLVYKWHRVNGQLHAKIKERTHQLELSRYELRRVYIQQADFFTKAFQDIRGPLATLNGVYNAAFFDVKDELALHYLRKTQITTDQLIDLINRLTLVNKLHQRELRREQIRASGMTDVSGREN